jgi:hypothetical protein
VYLPLRKSLWGVGLKKLSDLRLREVEEGGDKLREESLMETSVEIGRSQEGLGRSENHTSGIQKRIPT